MPLLINADEETEETISTPTTVLVLTSELLTQGATLPSTTSTTVDTREGVSKQREINWSQSQK